MTANTVSELVAELEGPNGGNAWHTLVDLGPVAVPELRLHFARAASPALRQAIVEIIDQFRRPDDLEFFAMALQDNVEGIWQAAIDALASQPGKASLDLMESQLQREAATLRPNNRKLSFLQEAVAELEKPDPFGVGEPGAGPA